MSIGIRGVNAKAGHIRQSVANVSCFCEYNVSLFLHGVGCDTFG